jgi:ataxia telangiectasia mutated family protein
MLSRRLSRRDLGGIRGGRSVSYLSFISVERSLMDWEQVEDPLVVLYESLDGEGTSGEIVFKIQLILFLVERHWSTFHNDVRDKVESAIIALLVHDDLQIQSWACVTIAALSHAQDSSAVVEFVTPKKAGKRKEVTKWDQVWTLAMRRITNPVTSRVACHTASLLLTRPDRVDPTLVVSSIESFARDLEVQGPNFPSDAVCTFFLSIHAIAMNNVRIYRLRLPEKIFAWLTTAWTPLDGVVRTFSIGQVRPRSDPFSPLHLAVLASRICGLEQTPIPPSVYTVPDCPIASMAVDRCETAGIRNYIQGRVPAYVVEDPTVQPSSAVPTPTGQQLVPDGLALKVSAWLRKSLLALDATGTDGGDKFWTTLEVSTARRYLDFASIALVFEGLVQLNNFRPSKETIKAASIVFLRLIPTLSLKKWSTVERTLLLGGLDLILVPLPDYPSISYPVLLDPGVASSLPRHLIPHRTHDTNVVDFSSLEMCLLRTIWSNEPTQDVLEELAVGLHHVLGGASAMAAAAASQATQAQATQGAQAMDVDEDDTFGAIKTSESTYASLTLRENDRSDSTCVSACVRGIVSNAMAKSRRVGSVRVPSLVDSIVEAGGTQSVAIIEHVCNAVWRGLVTLRIGEAEVMIQHIGGTLFPNYDHARSERFILAALRFLECTAPTWIRDQEDEGAAEFGEQARTLVAWYTNALFLKKLDPWRVRVRFAAFLDTYLSLDRTQTLWDGGDIATRNGEGDVLLPTGMLPSMLGDVDFRVRFHAATSAPRLFNLLYENGHDEKALFNDIRRTFINMNIDEAEIVLTQILANANMMIISHSRRRAPYLFLLDIAGVSHSFTSQIRAVLVGAAARLGLKDIASLYQIYARFYGHRNVMKRREDHSEPNPIPFIVCGYPSLRAVRKDDLRAVGAVLLTYRAEDDFQTVCDIVKRSRQACVLECLAGAIAHITVRTAFEPPEDDPSSNILVHRIEELASGAGAKDAAAITSLIASVSDEVVVAMLGFVHEDLVLVSQAHIALAADAKASKTLSDLLRHSTNLSFVELEPPYYSLQTVVDACLWFSKKFHVFNKPATVYSIVHQLLTQIHRAPFIDMKRRGLFKLAIALALSCRVVEDATILADLVQSLIVLLPDVDLAPLVASILRWCLLQWVNLAEALRGSMGELCGSLVRGVYACGALKAAALEASELDSVSLVADSTIGFLEALLETFAEHPTEEVDAAALLWPTPIVDPAGYATSVLVEALSTSFAPRTKYRLINELLARRRRSDNHVHQPVLWRILDAMSPSDPPEAVDCIALADLLYESSGDVERPGMDELPSSVSAAVPINVQGGQDVHKVIVVELLKSIHSSDTELASLILDTLRLVFSVTSAEDLLSMGELSPHSLGVATFLASPTLLRPERARAREQRSLAELSSSLWKSQARVHDDWIRRFAQLLADYRAEGDAFFAQLVPILEKSVALASSLVPILLHSILIQGSSADDDEEECILSEYLEALLSSRSTSNECISCIVDIIVCLRRNSKPHDTALTSCDKWLRVPWILAAEGAVRVGRYLTALLFLELSHEYDSTSSPDITADDLLARGQDLLYEIYANIDEPDGFYGRESPDVRKALVKRYEHEGRWSEAFSIYGADYESQSRQDNAIDTSMTPGVVQSLASSGFNRLAMSILQPARAQGDIKDDCIATGLPYELGWRTESWDLPVEQSSATDSSVALYRALRSLHVAREPSGLQASVAVSIVAEVKKLASVSINLPTPNGDALSTILALREVHQWSMLKIGDDDSLLSRFSIVPPSFK